MQGHCRLQRGERHSFAAQLVDNNIDDRDESKNGDVFMRSKEYEEYTQRFVSDGADGERGCGNTNLKHTGEGPEVVNKLDLLGRRDGGRTRDLKG